MIDLGLKHLSWKGNVKTKLREEKVKRTRAVSYLAFAV
jgi:hypothetical protein